MSASDFREFRARAKLTQTQLAEQLGLSLRAVQDIESGKTPARKIHLYALNWVSMSMAIEERHANLASEHVRSAAMELVGVMYPEFLTRDPGPQHLGPWRDHPEP